MECPPRLQAPKTRTESTGLMRLQYSFILFFSALLLISCGDDAGKIALQRFSGAPADVVLVIDDAYWNGASGDMLKEAFSQPYPMLPQYEPRFNLHSFPKHKFSQMLRLNRTVIVADIEDNERNLETRASQQDNKWAKGQTVYTIHARTEADFISEFNKVGYKIIQDISAKDRDRIEGYIRSVESGVIRADLKKELALELTLHKDFTTAKSGKDFMWLRRERVDYLSGIPHDVLMGVIVYTYPYTSDSLFGRKSMLAHRDSIVGNTIRSSNNTPMVTEPRLPAELDTSDFHGHFSVLMRGLWKFNDPIMGGPFVSLSVVDEKKGRMITVDGYVFAPKFDKRNYIMELEAILYSLSF